MTTNFFIFLVALVSSISLIYLIYTILQTSPKQQTKELQISKKDILEQANLLLKQKKFKLVEKLCKKYLESKPEYIELRIVLAKTLYNDDNIYEAIKECLIVLTKDDTSIETRLLLARSYKKVNQYAKAISELQEVLKQDSENSVAVKNLSEIYLETNQKLSAIKILKKLSTMTENNLELMQIKTTLSDLFIEMENYPEAFDELNEILEIYPEDTETNKKLIELYIKVQNYDSAILNCEHLLELNENNSLSLWLLNNLINLYYLTNDTDKTMEYAKKLLEHPFSDKIKTKIYIAKILLASGKEEDGIKLLNELSEKNNENIEIKRLMINNYIKNNNFTSAIKLYKEILDLVNPLEVKGIHTEISNLYVKWAITLFDKNEMEDCFKIFTLAVQYDNSNPEVYYQLGYVNQFIKNYNEAILQIKKSINLSPQTTKYYLTLAECYEALGNTFEEKDTLLNAIKTDENNTKAYMKLATLYDEQRDKQSEIKTLEKILSINPDHLEAKYQLALLLESQGNKEEALKLYKEIESINYEFKNVRENIQMLTTEDESQEL